MRDKYLRSVGAKNQITIPVSLLHKAGIDRGDYLEVSMGDSEDEIVIRKMASEQEEWSSDDILELQETIEQEIYKEEFTDCNSEDQVKEHLKKLRKE